MLHPKESHEVFWNPSYLIAVGWVLCQATCLSCMEEKCFLTNKITIEGEKVLIKDRSLIELYNNAMMIIIYIYSTV